LQDFQSAIYIDFFLHMNSKPQECEDAQNCSITRTIQAHENVPQAGYIIHIHHYAMSNSVILCYSYNI